MRYGRRITGNRSQFILLPVTTKLMAQSERRPHQQQAQAGEEQRHPQPNRHCIGRTDNLASTRPKPFEIDGKIHQKGPFLHPSHHRHVRYQRDGGQKSNGHNNTRRPISSSPPGYRYCAGRNSEQENRVIVEALHAEQGQRHSCHDPPDGRRGWRIHQAPKTSKGK